MRFDRNSAAASLLVMLACGLVVMPAGDRGKATDGLTVPVAPAKSARRLVLNDEGDAVAWIHSVAGRVIADSEFRIEGNSLDKAVSLLKLDEVFRLLGDPDYWPEDLVFEPWKRLLPLRKMLLERVAVLDLQRGLDAFPHEARLLLEVAAREDGTAALEAWLAVKEEWRQRPGRLSVESDVNIQWIEGVGEVPEISISDGYEEPETALLSRLMKGWASSAPEEAWAAFKSQENLSYSDSAAVKGLIAGLAEGSDWKEWASRIESFGWQVPGKDAFVFSPAPESQSTVALASRWIAEDAGAALDWYREREATWDESQTYFHVSDWSTGTTVQGNSHLRVVPMVAPVYAAWLEKRPEQALAYLENSAGTERDPFQYLVKWTELPTETKIAVVEIMPHGKGKDDASIDLAKRASWASAGDRETALARLEAIAQIEGLQVEALAEIEKVKGDVVAREARGFTEKP